MILVTEDKAIYEAIDGLRGKGLGEIDNGYDYLFCVRCDFDSSRFKESGIMLALYDGWGMKDEYSWWDGLSKVTIKMKGGGEAEEWQKNLSSTIAAAFHTNGVDCKDYSIAASDIMEKFQRNSKALGAPYYGGGYSQLLFCDFVDEGHKRGYNYREISPSDMFEVFWRETTKNLWQRGAICSHGGRFYLVSLHLCYLSYCLLSSHRGLSTESGKRLLRRSKHWRQYASPEESDCRSR